MVEGVAAVVVVIAAAAVAIDVSPGQWRLRGDRACGSLGLTGDLRMERLDRRASDDKGVVRNILPGEEPLMLTFPADEQTISEVERGRSCQAIVPLPHGEMMSVGDTVLFALSHARPGQQPVYVKEGDSVLVCLTHVVDLGRFDLASGLPLVQLTWNPLGRGDCSAAVPMRGVRSGSHGHP